MKTTSQFKETILEYLENRAQTDILFAESYHKEGKNIDDCITYILNTVQKSECAGFTDDEVYSMAMHYYDEDIIDIGKAVDCRIVINHTVELTDEEIAQAREDAIRKVREDAVAQMRSPKQTKIITTEEKPTQVQQSLF